MVKKPNVGKITKGLKDFQKRTVDYVFSRLYTDQNEADRFLIADEVGLGKTLVARGVIAKAINFLWEDIDRIDIIYICANSSIAKQNINRLNITGEREFSFATRITLLPLQIHNLKQNKLNFVSFTPGTSFDLRSQGGRAIERILLYHILREGWNFGDIAGPKNVFQNRVTKDNWRRRLKNFDKNRIDKDLKDAFLKELNKHPELKEEFYDLIDRYSHFTKYENLSEKDKKDRVRFIGKLRQMLAETSIDELEPDIVIMDEFQRFKYLLDGEDDIAKLARSLFNYPAVKIMLLSATPYKMYTMYHESSVENHYKDLLRTIEFLFDSKEKADSFKNNLKEYRKELFRLNNSKENNLFDIKSKIENELNKIMVRNEKIDTSKDKDAMLIELEKETSNLSLKELNYYSLLDKVREIIGAQNVINYWKSAPYLLNFMDKKYKLKERFLEAFKKEEQIEQLKEILTEHKDLLLSWNNIDNFNKIEHINSKVKSIISQTVDNGSWKLLWIPPSLPYYKVNEGPYSENTLKDFTKTLIFSHWRVVPRVISILCSYEAERRIAEANNKNLTYDDLSGSSGQLLNFVTREEGPANMSNFNLFYPCFTLGKEINLIKISKENSTLNEKELIKKAENKIKKLMKPILKKYRSDDNNIDQRWYWASLALLDKEYNNNYLKEWLNNKQDNWRKLIEGKGANSFIDHVDYFQKCFDEEVNLGQPPRDLIRVLAKIALGSPAIISLRSYMRLIEKQDEKSLYKDLLSAAAKTSINFRTLYNRPDSIHLIRSIYGEKESRYWESILDYNINGNLQSVMDEYVHILRETNGLTNKEAKYAISEISQYIEEALTIRSVTPQIDEIKVEPELEVKSRSMRCHFALEFGDFKDEEGTKTRSDQVRTGFNSPFRPFILATTSIGQEGLDFHLYSHRIYHWNLPSNPVDLEQREGRIHRYKGHAIRRNVAANFNIYELPLIKKYEDPWDIIFDLANRYKDEELNDMVPYWIYEIEKGYKIYRHVPNLPLSNETNKLQYLKNTLGAYRMVFGQPRQEDLVNYLSQHIGKNITEEDIIDYKISLKP